MSSLRWLLVAAVLVPSTSLAQSSADAGVDGGDVSDGGADAAANGGSDDGAAAGGAEEGAADGGADGRADGGADGAADAPEGEGADEVSAEESELGETSAEAEADDDPSLYELTEDEVHGTEEGEGAAVTDDDDTDAEVRDSDLRTRDVLAVGYRPEDVLRVGGGITLLDQRQLETMEYDDPHVVLMQAPGVFVRTEDGFGLRPNIGIRGTSSDRSKKITLMEDGVLFGPAPYAAPAAYYFPLMTRMTGVEVFKGPASLLYGPQTIGGAINLVTREVPTRSEGAFDLSFGRFLTRKIHLHWGTSNRWGGFLFEALEVGSRGFKELDQTGGSFDPPTGFSRSDFVLRGFLQTNPDGEHFHRVDLRLGFGRERSDETYLGLTDADFIADPTRRYAASELDRMTWWRTSGVLTWRAELGEHVQIVTDVYRHDLDRSWLRFNGFGDPSVSPRQVLLSPTGARSLYYDLLTGTQDTSSPAEEIILADNQRRYVSQGGQTRLRVDAQTGALAHHVEVGLRLHQDQIERDHLAYRYAMQRGSLVAVDAPAATTTDNLGWAFAFAGYAIYRAEIGGLTLTPGLRTEVVKTRLEDRASGETIENVNTAVLPGIGATYEVIEHLSLLAGVHRGYSPVAPGQPEEVEPELSVNYELGARYADAEEGRLIELVGFVNDYSNLTGQCGFSTGCSGDMLDRQFNGGAVLIWGLEAAGSWRFEVGRFAIPLRLTYTYTGSHFREGFESEDPTFGDVREGDELPYVPAHQGQLQGGLEHERGGFQVIGTYVSEMREQAGQGDAGERTDDYVLVDAVAWWEASERVRLYVRGENLLDDQPIASRRPFGAVPLRPVTVQVGAKVEF
ncbi:MAG: TonB-dependent receptor [Myxococcota bacterium]|nr:TonB-dependent receptor [Myxococcota bacterium]